MAKINVLDSKVYNKISAGEVVESPTSVVKELVENALDAGAKRIFVNVGEEISTITVGDDGSGIEKSEFKKVFLPHATSKINDAEDLFNIRSLGFRGEAMASIAAVSEVELLSSVDGVSAYSLSVKGGEIVEIIEGTRSKGTTITVSNLFFNTPARMKFMKKAKNELHSITALMQKFALANPEIVFEYTNENGTQLITDGDGLLSAMSAVYGDEVIDKTIEINCEEYGMRMWGFVSSTTYPKPTRANQTFIVNGRIVTNIALVTALNNVYNDYFVKRYYPFAVLCLKVDPKEIDVNVHPQKTEIKFEYQSKVFGFVQRNLRKKLEDSLKENTFAYGELGGVIGDEWRTPFVPDSKKTVKDSTPVNNTANDVYFDKFPPVKPSTVNEFKGDKNELKKVVEEAKNISFDNFVDDYLSPSTDSECESTSDEPNSTFVQEEVKLETKEGVDFKYAGQLFGTYILLEYQENVLIIDQHAAAEFTLYSKLKEQIEKNGLIIQPLMLPYEFKVDDQDVVAFMDKLDAFKEIGIDIEKGINNTFKINALPLLLVGLNVEYLISELLSDKSIDLPIKEKLMVTACRSAIKGNTYLDEDGIKAFMINTFKDGIKPKCPHGRPAFTVLTKKDLEKMFMRIC